MSLVGGEKILFYLGELGKRLEQADVVGEIYIVGGSAVAIAYNKDRFTADIDAWYYPTTIIREICDDMRSDFPELEPNWLNDSCKTWINTEKWISGDTEYQQLHNLKIQVAKPEHMLAMKVASARLSKDVEDIKLLINILGLTSADEVFDIVQNSYGSFLAQKLLTPRSQFMIQELFNDYSVWGMQVDNDTDET